MFCQVTPYFDFKIWPQNENLNNSYYKHILYSYRFSNVNTDIKKNNPSPFLGYQNNFLTKDAWELILKQNFPLEDPNEPKWNNSF